MEGGDACLNSNGKGGAIAIVHRPLSTPVLIGRDDLLDLGRRRAEGARGGRGHLLFLAGEAGIGKTRLLGSIGREASRQGMRVVAAGAFSSDLDLPGALLLDLAHSLAIGGTDAEREAGAAILARLTAAADRGRGDPHRRRRILVVEVADRIADLASDGAVMLALEDLHWADDLTMETLGQLARRVESLRMLVVGTYRSDELYPQVPMREWRARLITQRLAEEARLGRLTLEQTAAMAGHLLHGSLPPPSHVVETLQHRSDGIPLHVEEILGAMRFDPSSAEPGMPVPDTLTDAILARRAALSEDAGLAADAAAIIDRSFDLDLLAAVADRPVDIVAASIAELESRYFIVPVGARGWFDVRHALIRDALEAGMTLARRRTLHQRVARHVAGRPTLGDDGYLSAHFEAAGLRDEAYHHARAAATSAAALSAHREALDLYRRAIRCAPDDLAVDERAALHAARAAEEASTDDNESAAATYDEARRLFLDAGRPGQAAALLPPLVAARHLLGDPLEDRVAALTGGLAELDGDEDADASVRARLVAGLSAAYMLDRRLDESVDHGSQAIALAAEAGDEITELNALVTLGSVLMLAGKHGEGWARLEEAVRRARSLRLEAEAARAYRMIGSCASVVVEYERGERWLREGIEYAERTEQWNHRHYMASHLGHVLWAIGEWADAEEVTQHAFADGRGGVTTRITALHVLGYLALGRSDWATAEAILGEARAIGEEMRELQRFSPALWGLAEAALLQGRHAEAIEYTDAGHRASGAVRDAVYLYPFLVTGTRARLALGDLPAAGRWVADVSAALRERSIPGTMPAIHHAEGLLELARGATGRARASLTAARAGWLERRRSWEGCGSTIDLARCALRANRPGEAAALVTKARSAAEHMGAHALLEAVLEVESRLRRRGVVQEPWAPLTAREFEVASLIAAGRTNREIATELTITPKTVASHVEHILDRLGAERRTEIAAWVASIQAG